MRRAALVDASIFCLSRFSTSVYAKNADRFDMADLRRAIEPSFHREQRFSVRIQRHSSAVSGKNSKNFRAFGRSRLLREFGVLNKVIAV
jgi:hypothetical protein